VSPATVILDGSDIEPGVVGGKGFALNRLISMDAPVPRTGSVTTDGYRWFVQDSGLDGFIDGLRSSGPPNQADLDSAADLVDAAFLEARMPDALASEVLQLSHDIGAGKLLAVRSSATAEDMADASFAGQCVLCRSIPVISRDWGRRSAVAGGETGVGISLVTGAKGLPGAFECV